MQLHTPMLRIVWLLAAIIALESLAQETRAQQANRRGRPGEVITPAAPGERPKETLKVSDKAPDFTLPFSKGGGEARLADLHRDKPLVLLFGSISCPPFRRQVEQVEQLYQQHMKKANFAMVYVREAHPDSVIYVKDEKGGESLEKIAQTNDLKLRTQHAQTCARTLEISFPMLVDKPDNQVNAAYAGWPIRLVIIGTDGKVIDPGAPGPRGFDVEKVARWLEGKP